MRQEFWQLNKLATTVLLVMCSGMAIAQPDAGSLLESQKEPSQPPKPAPDISIEQPAPPALPETAGLSVNVTAFKISGNTVFAEGDLLPLIASYVGKELTFDELQEAANVLTAHYRKHGYFLAHAYLPKQNIKDGTVEIVILEGRVGQPKLHLNEGARLSESVAQGIVNQIEPGQLINETGLERPLLLLSDMPGVKVKSTLAPGSEVGAADVLVDVTDTGNFVTGDVGVDNGGNRFTGEYRLNGGVSVNNPTGLGDVLTVRGTNSDSGGMKLGRVSYTIPVFSQGTKIGAAYTDLNYRIGKDFANLGAHGRAGVFDGFVQHPFIRSRNLNVFGQLGYTQKRLQDVIDSIAASSEKKTTATALGVGGDSRDELAGGGLNTFSLSYTVGQLDIKTATDLAADQGATGYKTNGNYEKLNYGVGRLQSLGENLALFGNLSGQLASKNLDSSEKFSLGGPSGVRAYPVGEEPADEGYILTGEVRKTFGEPLLGGELMAFGFVDVGHAQAHKQALPTDTNLKRDLSAYGVGISWGETANYIVRATLAWKGSNNMPTSDVDRDPRMWFYVSKWF
ncbi:MAG: ShlB/FhaC/HecB family hemolysin secretion/activation protein [Nitrosomonadales bacterium]|nr:ShlB/FhaC/HecB family hemolysin secretion/activation protein [Nitrosomonadales bacterium]